MPKVRATAVAVVMLLLVCNASTVGAATRTVTLRIRGMTCEGCAVTIEKALKDTDGVLGARVSYEKGEAWIRFDDRRVSVAKLRKVIEGTGFEVATAPSNGEPPARNRRAANGVADTR